MILYSWVFLVYENHPSEFIINDYLSFYIKASG